MAAQKLSKREMRRTERSLASRVRDAAKTDYKRTALAVRRLNGKG